MTDLELDVWDAWLRERQEHLEETLSNISPCLLYTSDAADD